jgi:CII-binding regulator of phage lambda lysogenization HflD
MSENSVQLVYMSTVSSVRQRQRPVKGPMLVLEIIAENVAVVVLAVVTITTAALWRDLKD